MGKMIVALVCLLLAGCVSSGSGQWCAVQEQYAPPKSDLVHIKKADYTKRYLLGILKYGEKQCDWKKPK